MNQQPLVTGKSHPPHVYSEEEQQLRWSLIIAGILSDTNPELPQELRRITQPPVPKSNQPA
jgi:hypothetical protein